LPAPLVFLRDVDPSVLQDMRYATANNFTGAPVPGYAAGECVLHKDAAAALSRVQKALLARDLSLKVYDCYRPMRAVRSFVEWGKRPDPHPPTKRFFPGLDKSELVPRGYIAAQSMHSRGIAIDLTLVMVPAAAAAPLDPAAAYGPCTAAEAKRAPDNSIDMGTGYDCFDTLSHTANPDVTAEQRRWRETLVQAMAREGFENFDQEWWHFTYQPAADTPPMDVEVPAHPSPASK
jgi:D-alanyl-D-alanine dipeptidase